MPGQHSYEKMSQQWRGLSDIGSELTSPGMELKTSLTDNVVFNVNANSPLAPTFTQLNVFTTQEAANEFNAKKVESTVITMSRLRPKDKNVLFSTKVYGPTGYQQWASRVQTEDPTGMVRVYTMIVTTYEQLQPCLLFSTSPICMP